MAVTQISTIQIRRGFAQDIGNLAAGELAWAIDTQKLYIGNGTVAEGAPIGGISEILTQNFDVAEILGTYIYKGLEGGYEVITGPDASTPSARSFQNKIDDFVNVRDFGAKGNGITDDTAAIQRALDELYDRHSGNTRFSTRRALRFNGGRYRITQSLMVPPFVTLIGEGVESVQIISDGVDAEAVITLVTNTGNLPVDLPVPPVSYPEAVYVSNLSFVAQRDIDILRVNSANGCVFTDVNFIGPMTMPEDIGMGSACVSIDSSVNSTNNIQFHRCRISGLDYGAHIVGSNTTNVKFTQCQFDNLYSGIVTGHNVVGVKVTDSEFKDITTTAIYADVDSHGFVSANNSFINVGESTSTPVIVFQADNCYSIADYFSRLPYSGVNRVQASGYSVVSLSIDGFLRLGDSYTTPGRSFTIEPSTAGSTTDLLFAYSKGLITYSASRNTEQRIGTIKYSTNNTFGLTFDEEYSESNDLGLVLDLVLNGTGVPELHWDANNASGNIKFSFDVKSLN